ncbi:hypothetical protein KPH14_002254 [Odynerus spinipes]|uniref:Uncharacterized protein n=1 Tax=Odynerus spinipes TaxID=1348599 RepID=A0AAD9VNZ4_9HYME|nr:hypothetical protein KPH14_002254 [Odynerus spinipes]
MKTEKKRGGVPNRTKDRPRHPVVSLTHRPEVRTNELIVRAPPVDGITALTGPQSSDLATEFRFNKSPDISIQTFSLFEDYLTSASCENLTLQVQELGDKSSR